VLLRVKAESFTGCNTSLELVWMRIGVSCSRGDIEEILRCRAVRPPREKLWNEEAIFATIFLLYPLTNQYTDCESFRNFIKAE
jgi:hypothetical protein